MNYFAFLSSAVMGFLLNRFATRPNTKINKRFPNIRIKFIQVFPRVQIYYKNNTIWIHHWINYSIVLIITLTFNVGWLDSLYSKGYLTGAIIQGLTFPDWKTIVVKNRIDFDQLRKNLLPTK